MKPLFPLFFSGGLVLHADVATMTSKLKWDGLFGMNEAKIAVVMMLCSNCVFKGHLKLSFSDLDHMRVNTTQDSFLELAGFESSPSRHSSKKQLDRPLRK